MDVNLANSI